MNDTGKLCRQKIDNCGTIKMLLMLIVIAGHSIVYWTGTWFDKSPALQARYFATFYEYLNSFHIYAFTLVSGYIFAYKILGGGTKDIEVL